MNAVSIGSLKIGNGCPLAVIAGPCVIESEEHAIRTARSVQQAAEEAALPVIFKASYDKANRTSQASYRGPGLKEGLRILGEVKKQTGLPVLTDVHEVGQVGAAAPEPLESHLPDCCINRDRLL